MSQQGPVVSARAGPAGAATPGSRRRVVDLGLTVDRAAPRPLPDQLEHELRARLGRGELRPGDALPSSRALAAELGVSRGVVVEAYDRLTRQGLLVARPGAAVRVSSAVGSIRAASPEGPTPAGVPAWRLRLHPACTPPGTLDRRAWGAALRTALRDATEGSLASTDAAGDPSLRAALAAQLSRSRGVVTEPTHITVTSGVTDALRGLAPILRSRGGRVAVEDPGFAVHRATLMASGLEVVPVPADREGIDVDALARTDVGAVLLTPAHQMPLGVPLSPERRGALVRWARETGALLLEDDYDGELRYDRRGVRALHTLAPDCVVYLGTTSKVLSPAVRIGWCVTPPSLSEDVQGWRLPAGAPPSNMLQLALAEFLRSGAFDRGVARLRRRCAAQRAALLAAFAEVAPDLVPTGVEAGLVLAMHVRGVDSWAILRAALERRVELFAVDHDGGALLLVGFGLVDPTAAPHVAREVVEIVRSARG